MTGTISGPLSDRLRNRNLNQVRGIPRKVIILGCSGFIGSTLLKRFVSRRKFLVQGFRSKDLDLSQPGSWKKLCRIMDRGTLMIHAARARQMNDPVETFSLDLEITANIARTLQKQRIWKVVYFSSTAVYGDIKTQWNISEATPAAPSFPYGLAKWIGEHLMGAAAKASQTPLLILRPCMVFGPGDLGNAYGPTQFIRSIRSKGLIRLYGDGQESRDYIFIDDLIAVTEKLALNQSSGIYNIGSGTSRTFRQISEQLKRLAEGKFRVVRVKRNRPKASQKINCDKLKNKLRTFSFSLFEEALKTTWEDVLI